MPRKLSILPQLHDKGMHVEILQEKLLSLGYEIGRVDGDFGNKTKNAISAFQLSKDLTQTGIPDLITLHHLGLEVSSETDPNPVNAIVDLVDRSGISRLEWANRGQAPYGYYYGMALMFARLVARLRNGDHITQEIAKPLVPDAAHDALYRFDDVFRAMGMQNNDEVERLRHLMVLMFGLGLMESSGRHCVGWDRGKLTGWGNPAKIIVPTGPNSEAGLFQTSFDILSSVKPDTKTRLLEIFSNYKTNPDGLLDFFAKGAKCGPENDEIKGEGDAREFQRMAKECPAFTVEFNAVALRNVSRHWNPVIKKGDPEDGLEIKTACDELLQKIQTYADGIEVHDLTHLMTEVDYIAEMPTTISTSNTDKAKALEIADGIGQKAPLQILFDRAPESKANFWAIVDFNKPSSEERLFIFDLMNQTYRAFLVAHGKNSGEKYATVFSNVNGSNCSSLGVYKTATTYIGQHDLSLYLDGLDESNSYVRKRLIVIHKADYVVPNYKGTGRAGRSEGCFAVHPDYIDEVIISLKGGSYLLAWHKDH